jgi:hypothetical protein
MTPSEFIKAYNNFFNEDLEELTDLVYHTFTGERLFEFAHYIQTGNVLNETDSFQDGWEIYNEPEN